MGRRYLSFVCVGLKWGRVDGEKGKVFIGVRSYFFGFEIWGLFWSRGRK